MLLVELMLCNITQSTKVRSSQEDGAAYYMHIQASDLVMNIILYTLTQNCYHQGKAASDFLHATMKCITY